MILESTFDSILYNANAQRKLWYKNATLPTVVANTWYSYWTTVGDPLAGSFTTGSTTDLVVPTSATTGSAPFANATASLEVPTYVNNAQFLANAWVLSTQTGVVLLYDRLAHTGPLVLANGAFAGPWTGATGVTRPTSGYACELWAEIVTATQASAHTTTVTYTGAGGVAGRTATISFGGVAQPIAKMMPFTMDAASTAGGIRSIQAISGSASITGTVNFVILRRLLEVVVVANVPTPVDIRMIGAQRLYDASCISMAFWTTGSTAPTIYVDAGISTVKGG